jgi:hypothetical protein
MTLAAAALAATMRLVASHAYAEGAPPGFSGGFKEESCHACHFHEQLNTGGGRVTIEGLPASFEAGRRYTLTITLTRAGMKRAGFQLAARFKESGAQAGTLAPGPNEGERVTVENQSGVHYAGQKKAGSSVSAADATRWTIEWTAPDRGGAVIVHVSANAADGNESADGDFVYTTASETSPASARAVSRASLGRLPAAGSRAAFATTPAGRRSALARSAMFRNRGGSDFLRCCHGSRESVSIDRDVRGFVEGKRTEPLSASTLWFMQRNQLWRNVEAAAQLAKDKEFAVVLAVESAADGKALLAGVADSLVASYPHLSVERRHDLPRHFLGFVTWHDLVTRFGLPSDCWRGRRGRGGIPDRSSSSERPQQSREAHG